AATGSPTGYLVVRKIDSAPTGIPADGTDLGLGDPVGDGTVVAKGASLNFTQAGLVLTSAYFYQIFSYRGSGANINYLTSSPAPMIIPERLKLLAADPLFVTNSSFKAEWDPADGATGFELDVTLASEDFATLVVNARPESGFNDVVNS